MRQQQDRKAVLEKFEKLNDLDSVGSSDYARTGENDLMQHLHLGVIKHIKCGSSAPELAAQIDGFCKSTELKKITSSKEGSHLLGLI